MLTGTRHQAVFLNINSLLGPQTALMVRIYKDIWFIWAWHGCLYLHFNPKCTYLILEGGASWQAVVHLTKCSLKKSINLQTHDRIYQIQHHTLSMVYSISLCGWQRVDPIPPGSKQVAR